MRKFIVHTRAVPGCCKVSDDLPTVVEVEGEMVTAMEDPSILWLPEGEFKFRITKPDFLYESAEYKKEDGAKIKQLVPPVYCSHAVYYNVHQAHVKAEHIIRDSFEFAERKRGTKFTDEEVRAKFSEITEILL